MGEGHDCGCGGDCRCGHGESNAHHDRAEPHDGHSDHGSSCGCGTDAEASSSCGFTSGDRTEIEEAKAEPPDPQLDPTKSPGFGVEYDSLADIEVSRDVTIGEMDPADLTAADTDPVADVETERLLATLVDGTRKERQRAALALGEREPREGVVTALATVARTADDDDVRQFSVEALGKLGGDEAAATAATLASDDPDPWVRSEAVVTMDRLDRDDQRDSIEAALSDDHHAVRRNALISEFKRRGEGARDDLLDATNDPSERVREFAAHMLAGVDDGAVRETLRELAVEDPSDVVRATAENALDTDPDRFRRQFTGPTAEGETLLPGEDLLNRIPDL